jgi:hypothetical protein
VPQALGRILPQRGFDGGDEFLGTIGDVREPLLSVGTDDVAN